MMKVWNSVLLCALGIATVVSAGLAWKFHQDLAALRASNLNKDDYAKLLAQLKDAQDKIDKLQKSRGWALNRPRRDPAPGNSEAPSGSGADIKGPMKVPPADSGFAQFAALLDNPQFQNLTSARATVGIDSLFSGLLKNLKLTPEQASKFKNLLVEKQMAVFDTMAAAKAQGLDVRTDPQGFMAAVGSSQQDIDRQIQSMLGQDGFSQFQNYVQSLPSINTNKLLQDSLSYTGTPLTADQSTQLAQILMQHTPPPKNDPFSSVNWTMGVTQIDPNALGQIKGLLTPDQVQVLLNVTQQQQNLLDAQRRMGGGGAPRPVPQPAVGKTG